MSLIAAGLAAGVQVATGIANHNSQKRENQRNRDHQSQENQRNRDFNRQMWEDNNAYNDPARQMARLKSAGINPHLAYMNGSPMNTSNAPAHSSASGAAMGVAPRLDIQTDVNGMLQAMRQAAEIDLIKAQTNKTNTEAQGGEILNGINAQNLASQAERIALDFAQTSQNIKSSEKGIQVSDQNIKESIQRTVNLASTNENLKQTLLNLQTAQNLDEAKISQIIASIAVANAQIENYKAQTKLTNEKSATEKFVRSNIQAETQTKLEYIKTLERNNFIGDKYDLSNAENRFKGDSHKVELIKSQMYNEAKNGILKDVQISREQFNLLINQMNAPATTIKNWKDAINPLK